MKSYQLVIFISLSLAMVAMPSNAQRAVGTNASVVLKDLAKLGIQKIGELDLKNLQGEVDEVRWEVSSFQPPPAVAGSRRSAFYDPAVKKVIVTESVYRESAESLELLELHEALGALGYRDHTYSQSTALNILRNVSAPELRKKLVNTYGRTIFNKENLKATGGSSVGGGGDLTSITIKNKVIADVLKTGAPVDADFFVQYPEINFEPFVNAGNQFVGIEYEFTLIDPESSKGSLRGAMAGHVYQELFTVHFPALNWEFPENQDQIINEVKTKLLGIFPTYSEIPKTQIIPQGCHQNLKVVYPTTKDSRIGIIQSLRSGVMLGCLDRSMIVSGLSVKSPSW